MSFTFVIFINLIFQAGKLTVTDFEFAKTSIQNIEEVLRQFKIEIGNFRIFFLIKKFLLFFRISKAKKKMRGK